MGCGLPCSQVQVSTAGPDFGSFLLAGHNPASHGLREGGIAKDADGNHLRESTPVESE